ncbi:hypothetical protein [Galactobacillus timonensis]|nr:hypothetical protein [Galactobacillus timonensis]
MSKYKEILRLLSTTGLSGRQPANFMLAEILCLLSGKRRLH